MTGECCREQCDHEAAQDWKTKPSGEGGAFHAERPMGKEESDAFSWAPPTPRGYPIASMGQGPYRHFKADWRWRPEKIEQTVGHRHVIGVRLRGGEAGRCLRVDAREGVSMNKLPSLISAVIGSALDRAARDAGPSDLAWGLLAALRRIRMVVSVQAGYGAAAGVDDAIHAVFVERALALFGTPEALRVPLPAKGPAVGRVSAILEDVAMSCLTLNAYFPGNSAMMLAVSTLTERLLDVLGAVPDWARVAQELRITDSDEEEVAASDSRWNAPALH